MQVVMMMMNVKRRRKRRKEKRRGRHCHPNLKHLKAVRISAIAVVFSVQSGCGVVCGVVFCFQSVVVFT